MIKKFATEDEMLLTLQALTEQCMEWAKSEYGADWVQQYGSSDNLHSIAGRLKEIGKAIFGEEMDLSKQFIKLYDMTDTDFDISKLGDKLFEMLEWREKNQ